MSISENSNKKEGELPYDKDNWSETHNDYTDNFDYNNNINYNYSAPKNNFKTHKFNATKNTEEYSDNNKYNNKSGKKYNNYNKNYQFITEKKYSGNDYQEDIYKTSIFKPNPNENENKMQGLDIIATDANNFSSFSFF